MGFTLFKKEKSSLAIRKSNNSNNLEEIVEKVNFDFSTNYTIAF